MLEIAYRNIAQRHDPRFGGFDSAPLAALLADPEIEIVLHAGRQDVALLRRVWGTDIVNIFDTQIAAGFAGMIRVLYLGFGTYRVDWQPVIYALAVLSTIAATLFRPAHSALAAWSGSTRVMKANIMA